MRMPVIICLISGIFLAGCTTTPPSKPSPTEMAKLVRDHLILMDGNDLSPVVSQVKDNEIVFLGETHNEKYLLETGGVLAVALTAERPVVWAYESGYGSHLLMEEISLGKNKGLTFPRCPETIRSFNANCNPEQKILMTATDIENSIHKWESIEWKSIPVKFLQLLAGKSSSKNVTKEINEKIALLPEQDTFNKMDSYLNDLDRLFCKHFKTFSNEDQEENHFSMDLLNESNRYGYYSKILYPNHKLNPSQFQKVYDIRFRYFCKTIERAYKKARKRNGILICQVGNWHIDSSHRCEARYFEKTYSKTKGKTVSIRLIPLYSDKKKDENERVQDIDINVKNLMGNRRYSYLDLNELKKNAGQTLAWSQHYTHRDPKYDGVLYVRISPKNSDENE